MLDAAINRGYPAVYPDQSLLGTDSFGMGHDYHRLAFFVIPAPSVSEWHNEVPVGPNPGIDFHVDLATIGVDADDFVIRATLDGPAFCFAGLGLRGRISTLSKKNTTGGI
jgi:hypothetical protein